MASPTKIKRGGTILVVALASLLLAATASFAQEYPPGVAFGFSCTPESPAAGDSVSCNIVGAQPGETLSVSVLYDGETEIYSTELTASDEGTASFSFDVPADAVADITIIVIGSESGQISAELTLAVATDVTPDPSDPSDTATPVDGATPVAAPADDLPRTGIESSTLLAAGAALLMLGGFTVMAARRRDRGRASA